MNSKSVYEVISKILLELADVNSKGYVNDTNLFNLPVVKELLVLFGIRYKAYNKLKNKMHSYTPRIYK